MKIIRSLQLLFAAIICVLLIAIIFTPPTTYTNLETYLEAKRKDFGFPSISASLVRVNKPTQYISLGDTGFGNPEPKTPYFIASISKSFTALAVIRLAREQGIDLNTPIIDVIPEFRLAEEQETITISHLLSHASGLSDKTFLENLPNDASILTGTLALKNAKPLTPPGYQFNYFNMGYTVLGVLVEKLSGKSYESFMEEDFFKPLNLQNTYTLVPETPALAPGFASLNGLFVRLPTPKRTYALPAGFIISSVKDLSTLVTYYLDPESVPTNSGFASSDFSKVQSQAYENWPYGFGWFIEQKDGQRVVQHGGSLEGYLSQITMWPDINCAFVMLTNSNNTYQSLIGINIITQGVKDIITKGKTTSDSTFGYTYIIFWFVVLLLVTGIVKQVIKLFAMDLEHTPTTVGKTRLISNLLQTVFWLGILIFLPRMIGVVFNRGLDWPLALTVEPALFGLILVCSICELIISLFRTAKLLQQTFNREKHVHR